MNPFTPLSSTDSAYVEAEDRLCARTLPEKCLTIVAYLLPGIIVFLLINTSLHDQLTALFGLSSATYQFWVLVGLSFGWHFGYPLYRLRIRDGLSWPQVWRSLSLHRFSARGFFILTPIFFILLLFIAVPYMRFAFPPLQYWLAEFSTFAIPEHSLFSDYTKVYALSPWQLALLFLGNFIGEEVYFRGYLLKRSAFLGRHNWWIHSLLFSAYHFWQIPMTWALSFISLVFGYWMLKRRNLWELILLHILINLFLPLAVRLVFG